jgi:glutamate/tyrosine decarboxylase-like PLP-dependent enzyme
MSVDTHKFGMAHKGTSVVLYHDPALRKHQYTSITEWSGEPPAGCSVRAPALGGVCVFHRGCVYGSGTLGSTGAPAYR